VSVSDAAAPDTAPAPGDPKAKRRKGRPRRGDTPIVDWEAVDKALVHGERFTDPATGKEGTKYPSLVELGERHGVSRTRVWQYAQQARCYDRRKDAQLRTQAQYDSLVIEKLSASRAIATADIVGIVDQFLRGFEKELQGGRVRTDSAADFDRLIRLRELLLGRVDGRTELQGGLTLEAIQARHTRLRGQVDGMTPELTGTANDGTDADATERE